MTNQVILIQFFREVQRVIKKHGLNRVLNELRRIAVDCGDDYDSDICDYIISMTANHYLIQKDILLNSNKRGKVSEARRMCFALMKEHLHFSDDQIGDYFGGRSRQYVNRELLSLPINQEKFTTKHEAKFVSDFIMLSKQILFYKNNYHLNNKSKGDS